MLFTCHLRQLNWWHMHVWFVLNLGAALGPGITAMIEGLNQPLKQRMDIVFGMLIGSSVAALLVSFVFDILFCWIVLCMSGKRMYQMDSWWLSISLAIILKKFLLCSDKSNQSLILLKSLISFIILFQWPLPIGAKNAIWRQNLWFWSIKKK